MKHLIDNVYVVLKNADFTEGRGPMLLDKVFSSLELACRYVDSRPSGVYGAMPPSGTTISEWSLSEKDGGWSGYKIKEVELDA